MGPNAPRPIQNMEASNRSKSRWSVAEVVFYLLILALPFEEVVSIGGGSVVKWFGVLFILVSVFEAKTFYSHFPVAFIGYALYAAIGIAGDLRQPDLTLAVLIEVMRPVLTGIFMLATYNLALNRQPNRLVVTLILSAIVFAAFQYYGLASGSANTYAQMAEQGQKLERASALGTDPNFAAVFMSLAVIPGVLAISGALRTNLFYKIPGVAGAALAGGGILMTGSRGGLIALVIGILSVLLVTRNFMVRFKLVVVVAGVLGLLGLAVAQSELYRTRLMDSLDKRDTAAREDIWHDALSVSTQSPLFGFGNRSYETALGNYSHTKETATHNVPLAILLGTGIAGLLALGSFYLQVARSVWIHRQSKTGMVVFPWFMIVLAGSLSLNLDLVKWYWLVMTLALALRKTEVTLPRRRAPAFDALACASQSLTSRPLGNPGLMNPLSPNQNYE